MPLGVALVVAGFSWHRAVALAALTTLGIELLQMKVIVGRDASLGDLLANTLGAALGAFLAARWRQFVTPGASQARRLALAYAVTLLWIWTGTAWSLGPAFPQGTLWFGAWAPELDNFERFLGRPLTVNAGGELLLPGGPVLDQQRLEDAISARPTMAFRATLGERPSGLAPIGLIVAEWHGNVMLLGQDRQDLAFGLAMRAAIVRLRTPTVYLRNGLAGAPGDTVEGEGALRNGTFELRSRLGGQELSRHLPLSASWGWSLITPWESVLGEEVHSLTAFWIIGLIAILAYWSVLAGGGSLVIPPVTVLLLLGAVPRAAGFPPAHWTEWMAALIGILLGLLASRPAARARTRGAEPAYRRGTLDASGGDPMTRRPPIGLAGLTLAAGALLLSCESGSDINAPPTATISTPAAGSLFSGGETIDFSGTGSDPEDGTLPASDFTWWVDLHHATHTHPFVPQTTGVTSGSFLVPSRGHTEDDIFLRIYLVVVDADGVADTSYVDVQPRKVTLSFASAPSGVRVDARGSAPSDPLQPPGGGRDGTRSRSAHPAGDRAGQPGLGLLVRRRGQPAHGRDPDNEHHLYRHLPDRGDRQPAPYRQPDGPHRRREHRAGHRHPDDRHGIGS